MSSKKITNASYSSNKVRIGMKHQATNELEPDNNISTAIQHDAKPELSKDELRSRFKDELNELFVAEVEKAKKLGYEEGITNAKRDLEEKKDKGLEEIQKKIDILKILTDNFKSDESKYIGQYKENITEIIYKILSTVIQNPEVYSTLVKDMVVKELANISDSNITIKVNQNDKELLESLDIDALATKFEIRVDNSNTYGGVVIETNDVTIDARLENILQNTKKLLLAAHNE